MICANEEAVNVSVSFCRNVSVTRSTTVCSQLQATVLMNLQEQLRLINLLRNYMNKVIILPAEHTPTCHFCGEKIHGHMTYKNDNVC